MTYIQQGLSVSYVLENLGLTRSTYYYKSTGKPKGKKPSAYTLNRNGQRISNEGLMQIVSQILSQEFIDYGYKTTTYVLRKLGWIVNPKKVYRLMKQYNLLYPKRKSRKLFKKYVEQTMPEASYPGQTIEVDIKYIWLDQIRRFGYLLTFLCVKTRFVFAKSLALTMKASQVAQLVDQVVSHPFLRTIQQKKASKFKIRSDNGPQFISEKLAKRMRDLSLDHEFIMPGTPEQNGHIEGFHSTVERLVCQSYELNHLHQAHEIFERFYHTYNYKRIMKSINYRTPYEAIQDWFIDNKIELPTLEHNGCTIPDISTTLNSNINPFSCPVL